MTSLLPPKNRGGFEVAIICALPLEADAAEAFFDCFWDKDGDRYGKAQGDQNSYRTGAIGNHNVVLAYMPGIGKGYAASVAASFRSSFQGIRLALIVGICGAVPQMKDKDIFLGDIIISDEIVRYDFGRRYPAGFYRKETTADSAVNTEVQAFLHKLKSRTGRENLLDRTYHHLRDLQKRSGDYCCPGSVRDRLFQPTYRHKHRGHSECGDCQKRKLCKSAQDATCESLRCDNKKLIVRSRPSPDGLDIHFGRIASGDTVMKSGVDRDKIADQESVIAFEMEGAGVCNNLPCIVVKGVCDYADSHKDKLWQDYTAGAAAACMRSLLEQWASTSRLDESEEECKDPSEGNTSSHLDTHPEVPSSQLPPLDEGFHSTKSHEASFDDFVEGKNPLIATVLLSVEFSFKTALSWFKQHRKYLPRDVDLRSKLKTQRVIFSSNTEILTYNASGPIEGRLALPTKDCFEVTLAIRKKLQEIEDITRRLPITTKAKVQSVSAITTLKDAVEDLQSLNRGFLSMIPQQKQARPPQEAELATNTKACRDFQHFRVVRQAACSLYVAFGTACTTHSVHNVHLSLKPDTAGTSNRVQFKLAFVPTAKVPEEAVWIDVETILKSSEPSQVVSASISRVSSSLKRQIDEGPWNPPGIRKRGQFQPLRTTLSALCREEDIKAIPNLYLQRNFCTMITRSLDQFTASRCIGLLADNDTCSHLAYINSHTSGTKTSASLSELIRLSGSNTTTEMGLYERVRLARHLAIAVLYYHATPWPKETWRSDKIHSFGSQESLLLRPQEVMLYMTTTIQASTSAQSSARSSDHHFFIRNPVLFGLGIMLLELAYQAPLETLQQPEDLQKGETPGFVEYFTAHRLAKDSDRKMSSRKFKDIVNQCLHCDFAHGNDFGSPALQEAFYHDVIIGLEKLETILKSLQLDDLEPDPI